MNDGNEKNTAELPSDLLRALIRERTHHRLERRVYASIHQGHPIPTSVVELIRRLMEEWERRGLPDDGADLQWAGQLLKWAEGIETDEKPDRVRGVPTTFNKTELSAIQRLIYDRRSIRRWKDESVPRWMVEKIVDAALWAPHAANLQSLRFVLVDDAAGLALFKGSEVEGGQVKIVVCQDTRVYALKPGIPERNILLDCGAAVQNMLLLAQAMGLGAVWLTFNSKRIERIRRHFQLPDYIAVQTYISLGWPAENPLPPGRLTFKDVVL